MTDSIRAVIDTNVLVSGLLGSQVSRSVIDAWLHERFVLLLSSQLVLELLDVLSRPKLSRYIDTDMQQIVLTSFAIHAEFTVPTNEINLCRDPKDNVFLTVAVAGHAHYLVTNDNDFLHDDVLLATMSKQYGVRVIAPLGFIELFK